MAEPGEFDNPYDGKDRAVYAEGFGRGYHAGRITAAALPDERLREALARANDDLILIADEAPEDIGESIDSVRAAIKDALAAADREKPDEDQT